MDIERAGQMEHRQSNPHRQFRQKVIVFGTSAQDIFLSHVLSAYQSHMRILILFSLLLHCLPSGLFLKVLHYCMHILTPRTDEGLFLRYTMNSLVLQTQQLNFFESEMLVIKKQTYFIRLYPLTVYNILSTCFDLLWLTIKECKLQGGVKRYKFEYTVK